MSYISPSLPKFENILNGVCMYAFQNSRCVLGVFPPPRESLKRFLVGEVAERWNCN